MVLTVFEYALGLRDILKGVKSKLAFEVISNLKTLNKRKITLELKGNKITLQHSGNVILTPDTFYDVISKEFKFLTYILKIEYEYLGKVRTLEKEAPFDEDPSLLLKSVMDIPFSQVDKIILQTKHFKIIYFLGKLSEKVVFEFENEDTALRMFRKLLAFVFPYYRPGLGINKVEHTIEANFKDDVVDVVVWIKHDGVKIGTKTNILKL